MANLNINRRLGGGRGLGGGGPTIPPSDFCYGEVALLLRFLESAGSTTVTDDSSYNRVPVAVNGGAHSTLQAKFGNTSWKTAGAGSNNDIQYANSDMELGLWKDQDWTVEAWIYPLSYPANPARSTIVGCLQSGIGNNWWQFYIGFDQSIGFNATLGGNPPATFVGGGTVPLNEWSYVAATFEAATTHCRVFLNGTQIDDDNAFVNPNSQTGADCFVGSSPGFTNYNFDGYIDALRVTNGCARNDGNTIDVPLTTFPDN